VESKPLDRYLNPSRQGNYKPPGETTDSLLWNLKSPGWISESLQWNKNPLDG